MLRSKYFWCPRVSSGLSKLTQCFFSGQAFVRKLMQSTYNCIIAHCSVCLSRYDPFNQVLLVWMYVRTCLHTYSHTYSYTYSYTYSHTYSHTCSELSLRMLLWNASYVHKPSRYTWQEWVVEGTWKTLRTCHRHSKRVVPARTTRNWIELIETESMKTTCRF